MKVKRGYFSIGIINGKTEFNVGGLWRSAHSFGAASIFTIGRRYPIQATDKSKAEQHIPLFEYQSWQDFTRPKGCELVVVEITDDAKPLPMFSHPMRACYILGAEDHGVPKAVIECCQSVVRIPSAFCLNVATAGSIVMYDRIAKSL